MKNQEMHETFLTAIAHERQRLSSRRGLLVNAAKLAGGGALAMSLGKGISFGPRAASAQDATPVFANDLEVLNYALTLQHLESAFYRDGLAAFTAADFDDGVYDNLMLVAGHEAEHVTLAHQCHQRRRWNARCRSQI